MARGYSGAPGRFGGRSYGGYGTTGDYGYGASADYGESQFGGGAEENPATSSERRRLTPEEYWRRYFGRSSYEGRTRGDDASDRFASPEAARGGSEGQTHRRAGPSRHPIAPRPIRRSDAELYEDICEALMQREDVDSSDVTVAVHEGEVLLEGSVPHRGMRYLIEDLAAGHPAVRDVDNKLRVRKP